jgi:hypothetical protein
MREQYVDTIGSGMKLREWGIIDLEGLCFIEQRYVRNGQNAQGGKWEMGKTQFSDILMCEAVF